MPEIEVRIGQLLEVGDPAHPYTRVVCRLNDEPDATTTTFEGWNVQRGQDGEWELYGFSGTGRPEDVTRWLPERLTLKQLETALDRHTDFGRHPQLRRPLMERFEAQYDKVSLVETP